MSAKRTYSWDFKAEVLAMYEVDGPAAAAREFEMPVRTIMSWAQRRGLHTMAGTKKATEAARNARQVKRELIRSLLLDCIVVALGEVLREGAESRERKDNATTAAILIDKVRLELGEATAREEVRHDYADLPDEDLIAEAEGILRAAADR